jgi:hypothetical protein
LCQAEVGQVQHLLGEDVADPGDRAGRRYGAYPVAGWLAGIVINLLSADPVLEHGARSATPRSDREEALDERLAARIRVFDDGQGFAICAAAFVAAAIAVADVGDVPAGVLAGSVALYGALALFGVGLRRVSLTARRPARR